MNNKNQNLITTLLNKPKLFLIIALIIASASLPFAIKLYAHLHSSIEEMLPRKSPSVKGLEVLRSRLGDNLQLTLFISGEKIEDLHRFADLFAKEAELIPAPNTPRFVDYRPSVIQDFYENRKLLFISLKDLNDLKSGIKRKIDDNPLLLGLGEDENPAPKIDIDAILEKYDNEVDQVPYFPTGYYESDHNDSLVMIFYPARGVTGHEGSQSFKDAIAKKADEVTASLHLSKLKVEYSGDVVSIIQEQKSLESDLLYSTTVVVLLESLLIFSFFRWIPSIFILGLPLITGVLVTFAISYFTIGSVNLTTAFLGSIIIGNGVNAGIILLARFLEERRNDLPSTAAMEIAVKQTWKLTLAASMAAALAYGSLMITTFRGYSQFGFIGALGMITCWTTTYLFSPPLAILLDQIWKVKKHDHSSTLIDAFFGAFGDFIIRNKQRILIFSIVVSAIATLLASNYARNPLEYDTTKLRSSDAKQKGGYLQVDSKAEAILRHNILPMVVLLKNPNDVPGVYDRYKKIINDKSILGSVLTMQSLVPENQEEKISIIKSLVQEISEKDQRHFKGKTKKYYNTAIEASKLSPFTQNDLPEILRRQFREKNGQEGNLVLLFPKYGTNTKDGRIVLKFAKEVRNVPLPAGAVVAGSHLVFADMLAAITHDGPIATFLSFMAVIFLSLWLSRGNLSGSFFITLSLLIGILWSIALIALSDIKINFLNFIALPITFGVGLDYTINVFGRYQLSEHNRHGLRKAIARSGSAVVVCSATTIIGYMSLLFSKNGALYSFGTLAILGEIACLTAALIILPALIQTKDEL